MKEIFRSSNKYNAIKEDNFIGINYSYLVLWNKNIFFIFWTKVTSNLLEY